LNKLCQFPESQGWDLKYRASKDGFSGNRFHKKCDGVSNTLTVIKTLNGNIFGAFAKKAWTNGSNVVDPKAFIISLINKENKPFKAMISSTHPQAYDEDEYDGNNYYHYSLNCVSSSGPSFGYNNLNGTSDIKIVSDSNANQKSSSNFGHSFKHQDYPKGSARAQAILAGSHTFQTIEIEVFIKKD
jgi:hypothetical protein